MFKNKEVIRIEDNKMTNFSAFVIASDFAELHVIENWCFSVYFF
ncbi:hypothetical protein T01_9125 [Trichinella spiralis]|uniref:Uncharacterized protein n=1 Tax=Trichinella spiralis TaxID=6334 RepID=A0A0V1AM91_TRISP|nr:hypothetical protein T01_9125 [Trichinella spiralis]